MADGAAVGVKVVGAGVGTTVGDGVGVAVGDGVGDGVGDTVATHVLSVLSPGFRNSYPPLHVQ